MEFRSLAYGLRVLHLPVPQGEWRRGRGIAIRNMIIDHLMSKKDYVNFPTISLNPFRPRR